MIEVGFSITLQATRTKAGGLKEMRPCQLND